MLLECQNTKVKFIYSQGSKFLLFTIFNCLEYCHKLIMNFLFNEITNVPIVNQCASLTLFTSFIFLYSGHTVYKFISVQITAIQQIICQLINSSSIHNKQMFKFKSFHDNIDQLVIVTRFQLHFIFIVVRAFLDPQFF